jgi:uncharacterized protein YceK
MGWKARPCNEAAACQDATVMRHAALLLLATALLGGCGRSVELTDASMSEVARALNEAVRQEPGQWETSTALEAMDLGKATDARAAAAIRGQIGKAKVDRGCLSPEQAAAPGFGQLRGGSCRFDRFAWKDGRLDARLHCARPDARVTLTQQGIPPPHSTCMRPCGRTHRRVAERR